MTNSCKADLSVVLSVPGFYESVRRVVRCLRAQTVSSRIEVVFVVPSAERLGLSPRDMAPFSSFQVVETGKLLSMPAADARGIESANAPLVVTGEDHAFPHPIWAERLLEAHGGPWAVVGPAIRNANPVSLIGWAQLLIEYGDWLEPLEAGECEALPGHFSCYKRRLLLDFAGNHLEQALTSQSAMHREMAARSHRLYCEPRAVVYHCNLWKLGPWVQDEVQASRKYAGRRARTWQWWRRAAYAFGSPLIPWVRLRRVLRHVARSPERRDLMPAVLWPILAGLCASAVGEAVGYLFGPRPLARPEGEYLFDRAEKVPHLHWHADLQREWERREC